MSLPTARINELPPLTVGLDLALADLIPIWISSENKTRKVTIQALNTFFATGGGNTHPPVVYGGEMIYIVPVVAAGTDTAYIPTIAGLDFTLERGGLPMIALLPDESNGPLGTNTAEFEVLDSGGFKLLQAGDALAFNERFKLSLFTLIGGGGGGTTETAFIKGKKIVNTNLALDPTGDINKIIQCRAGATALTITLPLIEDIEANGILILDTTLNQTKPVTFSTSGGQYIYFNGGSKTSIFLMPGEMCWLYRDTDGFYVMNDFNERYKSLAKPQAAFKADLNQLVCKGQELPRADYPRLWEYIQTLGSSIVSEATWQTASATISGRSVPFPYRGCFSTGDGSTTFRVPDMMNMFLRGVKTETGSDPERHLNKPGGYQDDSIEAHAHSMTFKKGKSDPTESGTEDNYLREPGSSGQNYGDSTFNSASYGYGGETRGENVGILWVINT